MRSHQAKPAGSRVTSLARSAGRFDAGLHDLLAAVLLGAPPPAGAHRQHEHSREGQQRLPGHRQQQPLTPVAQQPLAIEAPPLTVVLLLASVRLRLELEPTRTDQPAAEREVVAVLQPAEPTLDEATLVDLVRLRLERTELPAKVTRLCLALQPVAANAAQLRLWQLNGRRDLDADVAEHLALGVAEALHVPAADVDAVAVGERGHDAHADQREHRHDQKQELPIGEHRKPMGDER